MSIRTLLAPFSCGVVVVLSACAQPKAQPGAAPAAKPASKSRRHAFLGTVGVPQRRAVRGADMTTEIAHRAREILDANSSAAYGTEVPFEADGQTYIGRIEEHYHEPGGPKKPWGPHRGVTVYHAE